MQGADDKPCAQIDAQAALASSAFVLKQASCPVWCQPPLLHSPFLYMSDGTYAACCSSHCSMLQGPVWEQLDCICDRSTALAHTRSLRRRTQVERLQAELRLVRRALDRSEARNAHLQQQLAAAQATQQQ